MSRMVPFDEKAKCESCGKVGAFDFMGDLLCGDCATPPKPRPKVWPPCPNKCAQHRRACIFVPHSGNEHLCLICFANRAGIAVSGEPGGGK